MICNRFSPGRGWVEQHHQIPNAFPAAQTGAGLEAVAAPEHHRRRSPGHHTAPEVGFRLRPGEAPTREGQGRYGGLRRTFAAQGDA